MKRREFIAGLGAAAWPLAARAQQTERRRRVGMLMAVEENDPLGLVETGAFRQGLSELGWVEGRNITIEARWPGGNIELIERFAKELVELKSEVFVSRSTPATTALNKEKGAIPIVFVNVTEPVQQGFIQSFSRPGGKITGFANFDASAGGKMLQLLKELDPRVARVAVIYNPQTAPYGGSWTLSIKSAGLALGIDVHSMSVQSGAEVEAAIDTFASQSGGGLIAIPDSFAQGQYRSVIFAAASRNRIPAMYSGIFERPFEGLMGYATDTRDLMHRAADYVDRILKGADPAELPVQTPTRFNLVINRKVADALGLTISPQLSAFADQIIE